MTLLVLDEQFTARSLVDGLRSRGLKVKTVKDFGVTQRTDPDVVRTVDAHHSGQWVLVTMDVTIVEEHRRFEWDRYAIAWIVIREDLSGAAVERAKANILHRWAHEIVALRRGDQHTYYESRRAKTRPSLASQLKRKL